MMSFHRFINNATAPGNRRGRKRIFLESCNNSSKYSIRVVIGIFIWKNQNADIGDGYSRWSRGLPKPYHHFAALKDDLYVYVIGNIMRFIRIDSKGAVKVKIVKTIAHGFDGISAIEGNMYRESVYAIAEKRFNPKVHVCRFEKGRGENKIIADLKGIKTLEIRAMRFNRKDLIIILMGCPSFCLSIWKWTVEQELMMALCNEPSEFSDLLISPMNECHWVEYGRQHMTFYDLQSFTKNDVIRTQIYLPQRMTSVEHADPKFGAAYAMKIVSACFTSNGQFYALDDHYGIHLLNQEDKILNWTCSLGYTFLGVDITQIIPYGNCIAEVRQDGWILAYEPPEESGRMLIRESFKLASNIKRFIPILGKSESFVAITDKDGIIQEVDKGTVSDPVYLPDIMFTNIAGVTFIEPKSDYCAVLTEKGKICILDCEFGELIDEWKLNFKPTGICCHPVLPFVFCGAVNGCVNVMDIRNLKKPKVIARTYLTKDPNPFLNKFAFFCQGRYCIVADTNNDRIFAMYGYPFEEFDYIDSARLPGEIRHLNVPGSSREDLRIQVMLFAKDKVEELCPAYVYNFNLNNERLTLTASQAIENPIRALCIAPMRRYLYTYHVEKKKLALTPFCDDNTWTVLQEPELWIDSYFELDLNRMFVHGDRLYTFGEDGYLMVHDVPELPPRKDVNMFVRTLLKVRTHNLIDGGIKDGIVSMDGSQVITIGKDGTFSRVKIINLKPEAPAWKLLGYEKPRLIENQITSYIIDQEKYNSGKKPSNRIDDIRNLQRDVIPEDIDLVASSRFQSLALMHGAGLGKQKRQRKKKKKEKRLQDIKSSGVPGALIQNEELGEHDTLHMNLRPNTVVAPGEPVEPIQGPINISVENEDTVPRTEAEIKKEQIRRQMEEEREMDRTFGSDDGITEEDVRTIMEPKLEKSQNDSKGDLVDVPENETKKDSKKTKGKTKKDKYKNVKSKVAEDIRSKAKTKADATDGNTDADFVIEDDKSKSKPVEDAAKGQETYEEEWMGEGVEEEDNEDNAEDEEEEGTEEADETDDLSSAGRAAKRKNRKRGQPPKSATKSKSQRQTDQEEGESGVDDFDDSSKAKRKSLHPILLPVNDITDQFQESKRVIRFSTTEAEEPEKGFEGTDADGVYCFSHVVRKRDLSAPEFWALYEYVLYLRQYHPKAVALFQEFLNLISSMKRVMMFNGKRQETYQVEMMEFSLDEKYEEMLMEKAVKFVQYCHVLMKARNKLRHEKIKLFKNQIWDSYEQKGLLFTGFKTHTIVSNYPLKSFENTFGQMVKQCREERRLELKMEIDEQEIFDIGNEIVLDILKAELELTDPLSENELSMKNLDESGETDNHSSSGGDPDHDDVVSGRASEHGGGDNDGGAKQRKKKRKKDEAKGLKKSTNNPRAAKKKKGHADLEKMRSESPFGGRSPGGSRKASANKRKRTTTNPDDSDIRQRIRRRRYQQKELTPEQSNASLDAMVIKAAQERMMREKIAAQKRRKYGSTTLKHHLPKTPVNKGYSSSSDEKSSNSSGKRKVEFGGGDGRGTEDETSHADAQSIIVDDDASSTTSRRISRGSVMKRLKDPRVHPIPFGVFGPRGYHRRHHHHHRASGDAFILEEEEEEIRRKKSLLARKAKKKKEAEEARKRKKEQMSLLEAEGGPMLDFYIDSDDDLSEEDEEEFFNEMKNWKLEKMDEAPRSMYASVSETFDGSAIQDLTQMHGYKRSPYPYHQFEIVARHQFIRQMYFIMEEVYRMKQLFNKLFDDARYWKVSTIKKMATRNKRIREIFYYLKLDLDILDEIMDPREDPTIIFTVTKEEIPIERYLTAEQRLLEEQRLAEARARKNTRMAKFRRRALRVMMDGKLETKREEILLRDVPRPSFMAYKDVMEYSLEEYLESIEYQRKCEELEIERAELITELEAELFKLYRQNAFDFNGAELRVRELYLAKLQFHYNVVIEEAKIQRILRLIRITDDCLQEEERVNTMLSRLKDGMKSTESLISQLQVRKTECKTKLEELEEREKDLERKFRRDMGDVGQFFEFFVKNYKRRPKIPAKGLDKAEIYEYGLKALKSPNLRGFARENGDAGKAVALALVEIEDPMLMPQGCPRNFWDRFNKVRRERLAVNFETKSLSLDLEHINEGLQECAEREEESAKAMAAILAIISHRTDLRNYFIYNTEFQFVCGKGNVEIDYWELQAHEESFMTLAKSVEKLNNDIHVASELFIQDLKKSMAIHKDIKEMEWKYKVVQMAIKDGHQLVHDIASTKPTKQLLRILRLGLSFEHMHEDRLNLVRYLQESSIKFQQLYIESKNRTKKQYLYQQKLGEKTNSSLRGWLKEENKSTSLLKYIGIKESPEERIRRYRNRVNKFLLRGFMTRKMHQNFQTINYLEGELTRYYKKSFPVL